MSMAISTPKGSSSSPAPLQGILRRRSRSSSPMTTPSGSPSTSRRSSGVHFMEPPPDLSRLLEAYKEDPARGLAGLQNFIVKMQEQKGVGVVAWLQQLQENVVLLKPSLEKFVTAALMTPWVLQDRAVVAAYRQFLVNLISAQGYYTKVVVRIMAENLLGKASRESELQLEAKAFENVHDTIKAILELSPVGAKKLLLQSLKEAMPYMLLPSIHKHTKMIENMTKVITYLKEKEDRVHLLRLVIDRLVQLDAYLPNVEDGDSDDEDDEEGEDEEEEEENMFNMEMTQDKENPTTDDEIARRNLDQAMKVMFSFVKERHDSGNGKTFYHELLAAFESHILPTHATCHVQFLMFYLLCLDKKGKRVRHFLDWLWHKFSNPNTSSVIRQATVAYIASLLSRALFIDAPMALGCLEKIVTWIHGYIANRESKGRKDDFMFNDVRSHGAFYAACQAVFYVFAFRYKDFVHDEGMLKFLKSFNLTTIVTSNLNPLRVCLPAVVQNFASISRHYQLVYCDTVIERNNRIGLPVVSNDADWNGRPVLLDSFFPFDPYNLDLPEGILDGSYKFYKGNDINGAQDDEDDDEMEVEEEDELSDLMALSHTPKSKFIEDLMYGTSPGFKQ